MSQINALRPVMFDEGLQQDSSAEFSSDKDELVCPGHWQLSNNKAELRCNRWLPYLEGPVCITVVHCPTTASRVQWSPVTPRPPCSSSLPVAVRDILQPAGAVCPNEVRQWARQRQPEGRTPKSEPQVHPQSRASPPTRPAPGRKPGTRAAMTPKARQTGADSAGGLRGACGCARHRSSWRSSGAGPRLGLRGGAGLCGTV
ncbi:hypothetical protein E5288_WYG022091 [Bos mutus]|uniref:Uncharacterized protein n=1 Tax=Bos mutus TaxID=72004 RepID=A0A6B0SIY3_9CETA|nr:hypothetical protein [Bos mutus]